MNITLDLTPLEPLTVEIQKEYGPIIAYSVSDSFAFEGATATLRTIKEKLSDLETRRKGITKPLDDAKASVMDLFRGPKEQLERADRVIRAAMQAYLKAEEVKRIELQRQAEEKAKAVAAEEQRRLALEAEKDLAEGRELAAMEKIERAESVAVIPEIVPQGYKSKGATPTKNWTFQIVDVSLIPREYLVPDEKLLKALAKSRKEAASVPGVKFFAEESISLRAAR